VRVESEKLRCKTIGGEEHVPTLVVYGRKVDRKLSLNDVERLLMDWWVVRGMRWLKWGV